MLTHTLCACTPVFRSCMHDVSSALPSRLQVELLSWKSVKDISSDGGVIKTTLKEGDGWEKAKDRDEVLGEWSASLPASLARQQLAQCFVNSGGDLRPNEFQYFCGFNAASM